MTRSNKNLFDDVREIADLRQPQLVQFRTKHAEIEGMVVAALSLVPIYLTAALSGFEQVGRSGILAAAIIGAFRWGYVKFRQHQLSNVESEIMDNLVSKEVSN